MEILKAVNQPFIDLSWIILAFKEAWAKPRGQKIKHLKYRLLWELRPMLRVSGKTPLAVDVELCSYCNFRCTMCQQSSNWWNKLGISVDESLMQWETFKKIVDECVKLGVYSMKVNWRGEPMIHPQLCDFIAYMKQAGIHEVMMNTNASKLNFEISEKLVESGIDRIIFSCDGVSRETYNAIRAGGDWDVFIHNIRLFDSVKKSYQATGCKTPLVRLNASVQEANKHEIPEFRKIFEGLVDELRFNTIYNPMMENEKLKGEHRKEKRKGCPQIYQRMVIASDGDAVPCCGDYKKELLLGNAKEKSIEEMYKSDMGEIRLKHEDCEGRELEGCRNCDLFALSEWNENGDIVWK